MSTNTNPNINKFFNRLYISFPNISSINKSKEFGNMRYVYKTKNSDKWFVKYKTDQEVFLFGKIKDDSPQPPLLTLTFDKHSSYSKDCSGIINTKNVYINIEYFINNYPKFRTSLNETTIDVFINGHVNSINVIKLGNYVDNIDILIDNLDTLLNELDQFNHIKKTKPDSTIKSDDNRTCEICGKKLKNDKFKLCKKCSRKRNAANILINLLKYVEPQTPFEKNDLKQLYNDEMEVKHCIWSLIEFNLVTQNNNEYCLVNPAKLNEFIEEYGTADEIPFEKEEKKEEPKKLNKQCSICKKTLPTSKFYTTNKTDDGLEDYCKKCKKLVFAANCLKEILNQISPGCEFKLNDLKNNFKNPLEYNGRLYELQHNDLLFYDSDKDVYILADLETCQNFLDSYYIEGSIIIEPKIKKENDFEELTEEQQMDSVIESIKNGKTDKEAAEIASINLYEITYWFNEGKNNSSDKYINFYNRYTEAKKEVKANSYKNFYAIESFNIKDDLTIADTLRKQQMEKVLKEIGSGSSLKIAAFNSGITYETLQYWYKRGKQNFGEEYTEFYEKINILQSPINVPNPDEAIKKEEYDNSIEEKNNELKIPERYKHILDPLPHKFKQLFRGSKANESGFAWVRKSENSWRYDRQQKDNRQSISKLNIYDLYCEVKKQGYVWGVRNLKNAKQTLMQCKIPNINERIDEDIYKHILDPLSPEFSKRFKKPNSTGFAWVKKEGNSWRYNNKSLRVNVQNLNLYELYRSVKDKNLPWGVLDLEKAKNSLAQCRKPEIKAENLVKMSEFEDDYQFDHILDYLPQKYLKRFKKPNSSGIAWVKKISSNTWTYTNPKDNVRINDSNIYNLYLIVTEQNLPWGVLDLEKAKNSLAQCEKPNKILKIPESNHTISSKITCAYFSNNEIIKTIINGFVNDDEVLTIINNFKEFEGKLIRIITTRHSKDTELFMEFNLEKSEIKKFKELINKINCNSLIEPKKEIKDITKNPSSDVKYTEKYLLKGKSNTSIQLYNKIKEELLSNYENLEIIVNKFHVVFKVNDDYIASIAPLTQFLKGWINANHILDYKFELRDVTNIGHWGVGNYELKITSEEDVYYFIDLFKQSYDEKIK